MKKFTKIYLDLDGVVCNFEKRYEEMFGVTPSDSRSLKEFSPNWTKFIEDQQFETLDWYPGGQELLSFIRQIDLDVEILSSSGGKKYHNQVTEQKMKWLQDHGIDYKANIVPGRRKKAEYAKPDTILIDDTPDVIESFDAAGGVGILHKDAVKTIEKLKQLLEIN
jgi:PAS domain-containing protein